MWNNCSVQFYCNYFWGESLEFALFSTILIFFSGESLDFAVCEMIALFSIIVIIFQVDHLILLFVKWLLYSVLL